VAASPFLHQFLIMINPVTRRSAWLLQEGRLRRWWSKDPIFRYYYEPVQ
jgi:hypothetical protein